MDMHALIGMHAPLGKPFPEALYTNPSIVKAALTEHAHANCYAISTESTKAHRILYRCAKRGKYDSKGKDPDKHESKRRNTGTTKTRCKFMVEARAEDGGWKTKVLVNEHNHGLAGPSKGRKDRISWKSRLRR